MLALFFPVSTAAVLSGGAAATILSGQLHRERGFVSPSLVANLRRDLATLAEAGRFERAGSVSSDGASDELRSALKARPVVQGASEGDTDAFWTLHASLDAMRTQLEPALGRSLSSGMEVMYVVYPPGGYYKRHIDSLANVDQMGSGRRSVSFVCYLTPPWTENDGGELRVYGGEHLETVAEYPPESGSLVVFDSKALWHEVLPTHKERACLVGWLLDAS